MSLPKFIVGMVFTMIAVGTWSFLDSAPLGTVVLRAVVCAIVLQVGYFLFVLAMVARQSGNSRTSDAGKGRRPGDALPAKKDIPSIGRPLSH